MQLESSLPHGPDRVGTISGRDCRGSALRSWMQQAQPDEACSSGYNCPGAEVNDIEDYL